jgi:ribosomal protein L40E
MPVIVLTCKRCGAEWVWRNPSCHKCGEENLKDIGNDTDGARMMQCGTCGTVQPAGPKTCAKCRSPYWNKDRVRK